MPTNHKKMITMARYSKTAMVALISEVEMIVSNHLIGYKLPYYEEILWYFKLFPLLVTDNSNNSKKAYNCHFANCILNTYPYPDR